MRSCKEEPGNAGCASSSALTLYCSGFARTARQEPCSCVTQRALPPVQLNRTNAQALRANRRIPPVAAATNHLKRGHSSCPAPLAEARASQAAGSVLTQHPVQAAAAAAPGDAQHQGTADGVSQLHLTSQSGHTATTAVTQRSRRAALLPEHARDATSCADNSRPFMLNAIRQS